LVFGIYPAIFLNIFEAKLYVNFANTLSGV
jgi:hypothetical protein